MQASFCRPGLARVVPPGIATFLLLLFVFGGPAAAAERAAPAGAQVAQATQAAVPSPSGPAGEYRLSSGDRVRVIVYGQPDMTAEYSVDGVGLIAFPLVGRVKADGLTTRQLEQALVAKLDAGVLKDASVSIEVTAFRPFYVVGEVRQPGSYPFVWGMSVINAVALAGGFTYRAKESSFYVLRSDGSGGKTRLSATQETPVLPGDVITVRERWF